MSASNEDKPSNNTTSTLGHIWEWEGPWTEEQWQAFEDDIDYMRDRLDEADRMDMAATLEDAFGIKPEEP